MKITLVADWKQAHKFLSLHAAVIGAALSGAALGLSLAGGAAAWVDRIPHWAVFLIALVIFCATITARLIKQRLKRGK